MAKKEKESPIELKLKPGEKVKISVLGNAVCFFFHCVLIITENNAYRLIAVHKGKRLVDERYKTAKGAKIAFLKLYWHHVWHEGIRPYWTEFYSPDDDWLTERFAII